MSQAGNKDKNELLIIFQNITGLDVGEALSILLQKDWDFNNAVEYYNDNKELYQNSTNSEMNNSSVNASGASSNNKENLVFNIHYNKEVFVLELHKFAIIRDLKNELEKLTKVLIENQCIIGWHPIRKHDAENLNTTLDNVILDEKEIELALIDISKENDRKLKVLLEQIYTLHITQQPSNKEILIHFQGIKTTLDVKKKVYKLTKIPPLHQMWLGWPTDCVSTTMLAESGIGRKHALTLMSIQNEEDSDNSSVITSGSEPIDIDSESDSQTFTNNTPSILIPNEIDNLSLGSIEFIKNFTKRYGEPVPVFYNGTLQNALNEACNKRAKTRKMLAIYIHHRDSVFTNIFCDQIIKNENVIQILNQDFILFGWDITHDSNKNLLLSSITAHINMEKSLSIKDISLDLLPAMMIIGKCKNKYETVSMICGNIGINDFLVQLQTGITYYSMLIKNEIEIDELREVREKLKHDQDVEYQTALQADKAKEEAKKQKQIELENTNKRLEAEHLKMQTIKEENRQKAESQVPQEPSEYDKISIVSIKLRCFPSETLERKFYLHNTIEDLFNFLISKNYPIDEHKVYIGWPRRELTNSNLDRRTTLKELGLGHQEIIILEKKSVASIE